MNTQDKQRFVKAIKAFLYTLNGTGSPPEGAILAYWNALKEFPIDKVEASLNDLMVVASGHVRPAEVNAFISGKKKSSAKDAWDFYLNYLKRNGVAGMATDVCDDPKAQKALKAIGGARSMNVSAHDLSAVRSAFYDAYDSGLDKLKPV